MQSIENNAIHTYMQNLKYLQEFHQDTFKILDILNKAIQSNQYIEKYSLEYLDSYFDVLETKTNNYFYNTNSIEHAKELENSLSLKKDENVIEAFYNLTFEDASVEKINSLPLHNNRMGTLAKIINYTNKNTDKSSLMKDIPKIIILGSGLGLHIKNVIEKHNSTYIWIIEDDIELFRLSLFTTNYKELSKNKTLRFSIQKNDTDLNKDFNLYMLEGFADNNYIKYCLLTDYYSSKINIIQSFIVSQQYLTYPFYKMLARDIAAPKYIANNYNILDFKKKNNNTIFYDKPIIVIAAGPSLDKNIEWLSENKDKFIIISVMAALKTLQKHNIRPHIVIHVDATPDSLKFLNDEVYALLDESIILFSTYTIDPLVNLFSFEQVFFFEQGVNYKHNNTVIFAPSVGETAYAISLLVNSKEIYLLGLDLALDQETGMTHTSEHFRNKRSSNTTKKNVYSLHETKITVKGNFRDEVKTLSVLKQSIDKFPTLTSEYKKEKHNIYNLSDGAYLEGTIPTRTNEINLKVESNIPFKEIISSIRNYLLSSSSNKPSKQDKQMIEKRLKDASKIKLYLEAYSKIDIDTTKDFSESFGLLISNITLQKDNLDDTRGIFSFYIRYIIGYVSAFFNTQNIENENVHVKNINNIIIEQLLKIINTYINELSIHYKKY